MGIVGFGLGLFFGWILHRERAGGDGPSSETRTTDLATSQLAETSSRLEQADHDVVALRTQLTDAQHLLDERAATIEELERELARHRDSGSSDRVTAVAVDDGPVIPHGDAGADDAAPAAHVEDTDTADAPARHTATAPVDHAVDADDAHADDTASDATPADDTAADHGEPVPDDHAVDAAADDATTPGIAADADVDEFELDDTDVTEEVVLTAPSGTVAQPRDDVDQTQSFAVDETQAIAVAGPDDSADAEQTQRLALDETEAIAVPSSDDARVEETQRIEVDDTEAVGIVANDQGAADETQRLGVEDTEDAILAPEPSAGTTPADATHDDLQRIRGIGPAMQRQLNALGIVSVRQLAELDDGGLDALQRELPGIASRIRRGRWIKQARDLGSESSSAGS